ncbi:MAG: diguanylate cyclase/phosphodiesterase (GGDEF & EAL domains) with PAS/PAC sensor(s), partial [uncultured Chloroflexia bacterium]
MGEQIIGLIFANPLDRQLLASFVAESGLGVEILSPASLADLSGARISLVLADETSARAYGAELLALKWRLGSTVLPVLVTLRAQTDSAPWLQAGFDDVIRLPVTKVELRARLAVFLRLRQETAAQYHTVVDHLLVGVYRATLNGQLLMTNTTFEELAALTPGAFPSAEARARLEHDDEVVGLEIEQGSPDRMPRFLRENVRVMRDAHGMARYYDGTLEDITARKQADEALRAADQRAITAYEQLLARLAALAQSAGTAPDLATLFRALRVFVVQSTPSNTLFASLYDPETHLRECVYAWSEGVELDPATLPPLPLTESPPSRAIMTGEIIITDDLQAALVGQINIFVGGDIDPRLPRSSIAVPMLVLGRVIGAFEVQSPDLAAYHAEHVIALRMAANLAAIAVDNVQAFEREQRLRLETQASEERYRALVEHSSDALILTDGSRNVRYVNEKTLQLLGYASHELLGLHASELLHPDDETATHKCFTAVLQNPGVPFETRYRLRHKDGTWRWLEGTATNWLQYPAIAAVLLNQRDVTERKAAEEENERLHNELEQRVAQRTLELSAANAELEAFSYSVSHDLRAPLRAIAGLSQIVLEDFMPELSPELQGYLVRIGAATNRMGQLIDALLDLSRVSRSAIARDDVDMSALARSIASEMQLRDAERNVEWNITEGVLATGDGRLLRIVLENLLGNAWKFTSKH